MDTTTAVTKRSLSSAGDVRENSNSPAAGGRAKVDRSQQPTMLISIMSARGGCYLPETLAKKLASTLEEIDELRKNNKIIGFPVKEQEVGFIYPVWQFRESGEGTIEPLYGLDKVLDLLPHSDPWEKAAFLLDRNVSVYLTTPLDGLIEGNIDMVLETADSLYSQGAA